MQQRTISLIVSLAAMFAAVHGVARAQDDPPELSQVRGLYQKDVEFATRPIRDRYLLRLDSLKRTLGSRGDARGAAAIQDEIDRVHASIPDPGMEKFAGTWKIIYSSGATKRYVISQEGLVVYDEADGKRIPALKAKLMVKNNDVILDFKNGIIERFKLNGKNLAIERFDPKELYPNAPAGVMGTGTVVSGRKE